MKFSIVGILVSLGITVALGGVLRFFLPREQIQSYPIAGKNIIAFGDSLIQGVGAKEGKDFVSELAKRIGQPIINAGQSGDTTEEALGRLEEDVLLKNPGIVIVLLSGNDYLRQVPRETTFRNLELVINRLEERRAKVILLGVQGGIFRDYYRKDFGELARRKDVVYLPNVLEGIFGAPEFMSDFIHPNDQGYKIMAERVAPILLKLLR